MNESGETLWAKYIVVCIFRVYTLSTGLIGASSSSVTVELNKFATAHKVPLVSPYATATELSDTDHYPFFMRTVPTDGPLMDVSNLFCWL